MSNTMETETNNEPIRLSVDEETRGILEKVSGDLDDAMAKFVTKTHLSESFSELESRLVKSAHKQCDAQAKSFESIVDRLQAAEEFSGKVKDQVYESEQVILSEIEKRFDALNLSSDAVHLGLNTLHEIINRINTDAFQDRETMQIALARMEHLQSQMSEIAIAFDKANRPWWKKLFG